MPSDAENRVASIAPAFASNAGPERGASVPFETAALFAARVRADARHGLAVLLRNFAANASIFVLPWHALPQTIPMSSRDRALHNEIAARRALTPRAVRDALQAVEVSGAAGSDAQAAASRAADALRRRAASLQVALLCRLLLATRPDWSADPQAMLRRADLDAAAARFGLPAARLPELTGALAQELLPVGLPGIGRAEAAELALCGPLRLLTQELEVFARHLAGRACAATPELRPLYLQAARAAEQTHGLAAAALADLDAQLDALPPLLRGWPASAPALRAPIDRLDMLLDGWEPTLDHYAQRMADWLSASQERTLNVLASLAPAAQGTPNATRRTLS